MAIREGFDAVKFREQARVYCIRIRKAEHADDFAQFAVEQVLYYKHFQPWTWLVAKFFGKIYGSPHDSKRTLSVKHADSLERCHASESTLPPDPETFVSTEL